SDLIITFRKITNIVYPSGANTRCWGLAATAPPTRSAPPTAGLPSSATPDKLAQFSVSPTAFQELVTSSGGDCTADEIHSAYCRLALQRHPDKLAQFGVSPAAFQELAAAYKVFSDPRERMRGPLRCPYLAVQMPFGLTEYGTAGMVTPMGDVYSYGILLMETFTRKKPTDDLFVGELPMKKWVSESFSQTILSIADANLPT
ncbi:hypothetical protein RJ640_027908, partial [Escallonia rubra]